MTATNTYSLVGITAFLLLALFSSCEGFQISDNGNLDGMWHLVEVDSLATDVSVDYRYNGIYWSFQSDLMGLDDKLQRYESCLMRFELTGEQFRVFDPYVNNRNEGDIKVSEVSMIAPFGINALAEEFAVETLTKQRMILRSTSLRLRFKKY